MRHYDQEQRQRARRLRTDVWMIVALLVTTVTLGAFILIRPMGVSPAVACVTSPR